MNIAKKNGKLSGYMGTCFTRKLQVCEHYFLFSFNGLRMSNRGFSHLLAPLSHECDFDKLIKVT
jgi:hypothetical protein